MRMTMIAPTLFQTASHSGERIPDQFGIVGDADAGSVPVFGFSEVLGVAIQKAKAGSVIVDVCHRTTVTERGLLSIVKQPDHRRWLCGNRREFNGRVIVGPGAVEAFIERVMEKIDAGCADASWVGRAKPDGFSRLRLSVGAPGHFDIARQFQSLGQLDIPSLIRRVVEISLQGRGLAFFREKIIVIRHVNLRRESPLLEIVEALNALRGGLGLAQRRQQQRREDRDDGDDDEQFNQRETASVHLPGAAAKPWGETN